MRRALPIRARPTVALTNPATARLTEPLPGVPRVADGYASSRQATFSLHGPFAAGGAAGLRPRHGVGDDRAGGVGRRLLRRAGA